MTRTKFLKEGKWRTLETFWNSNGFALFRAPAGASIKLRYGFGWFGADRQKQTLNGSDQKKLSIGRWSVTRARIQAKASISTDITYEFFPVGPAEKP